MDPKPNTSVAVGQLAPDFELPAADGRVVRLSEFRGRKSVVLFFYPKDETLGCTVEACTFRDTYQDFADAGAEVIGISGDTIDSHTRFAHHHRLPMLLLSDREGIARARFGVKKALGIFPDRITFVIDRDGVVRQITSGRLRFKEHATQSLALVKQLGA
jgi:thioredoxin-dependent peroxiredoxin